MVLGIAITGAILVALMLAFLIYRATRTYEAGAHATYITTKNGAYHGALRAPTILWDPSIKVLREKSAPDISIITADATGTQWFERSLVKRRTGEISLRVHICSPRPFISRTAENRQLRVKARVAFQLDIDRIHIPSQMEAFGATLGSRIENLFDNAIGEHPNEGVRSKQSEIESKVLRALQDIEFPPDANHPTGMPLGIRVYEATFAYEPVLASTTGEGAGMSGAMSYLTDHFDDLTDTLASAKPEALDMLKHMLELQTRQTIVETLAKSGGLIAFTAQELGLSQAPQVRERYGLNPMTPPPSKEQPVQQPQADAGPPLPLTEQQKAMAYYAIGAPKAK